MPPALEELECDDVVEEEEEVEGGAPSESTPPSSSEEDNGSFFVTTAAVPPTRLPGAEIELIAGGGGEGTPFGMVVALGCGGGYLSLTLSI